mgnify:CR=1 FL=1
MESKVIVSFWLCLGSCWPRMFWLLDGVRKEVNSLQAEEVYWTVCPHCLGRGKKSRRLRKKVRLQYQKALAEYERNGGEGVAPERPKGHLDDCVDCVGSGLQAADGFPEADAKHYPHVAIIGGGIGGVALAVAFSQALRSEKKNEKDEENSE